ncbi:MAG: hypothetical protein ABIA93_03935 [Candidatus Woesearchaeota archaeon]
MSLETKTQETWLKRAYKKELPTMGNNLLAAGLSAGLTALVTRLAQNHGVSSEEAIAGIATATDLVTYNAALFGQLMFRDRKEIRDQNGRISVPMIARKAGEYLSFGASIFFSYGTLRGATQYVLQKAGVDPVHASLQTQAALTALYTGIMPPLRYALQNVWRSNSS